MPHMANLSWVYSFLTFNFIFVVAFMAFYTPSINLIKSKNKNKTNNNKWQW